MKEFNENISKMEQFFADDMATTLRKWQTSSIKLRGMQRKKRKNAPLY